MKFLVNGLNGRESVTPAAAVLILARAYISSRETELVRIQLRRTAVQIASGPQRIRHNVVSHVRIKDIES